MCGILVIGFPLYHVRYLHAMKKKASFLTAKLLLVRYRSTHGPEIEMLREVPDFFATNAKKRVDVGQAYLFFAQDQDIVFLARI